MKKKNSNAMFNKLTTNKITLYVVASIALLSLLGNIMYSEFSAILLFFLAGGVAYSFTKNMTIVLAVAFIVTTLASMSKSLFVNQEGMEGEMKEETEEETEGEMKEGLSEPVKKKPMKNEPEEKTKEKLTQLTPALFNNIPNKDQMQKQLGEATEMEQAYDNLEKIMGKENIQSISTDTKDLIKQQNELIKQLKTMTPALNNAMSSIGNLDLSKLTSMFSSATKSLSEMKTE
jgi:hypothetical protein